MNESLSVTVNLDDLRRALNKFYSPEVTRSDDGSVQLVMLTIDDRSTLEIAPPPVATVTLQGVES